MIAPVGASSFAEAVRMARRDLPGAQEDAEGEGLLHGGRGRGGLRSEPQVERRGRRSDPRGHRGRGVACRARTSFWRSIRRRANSSKTGSTCFDKSDGSKRTPAEMVAYWEDWVRQYPIASIEDGLAENDGSDGSSSREKLGGRIQLVGDDIFVTNPPSISQGHCRRRRQRRAHQAQPDRHPDRDLRPRSSWRSERPTARSSAIAPARPATTSSPTSRWRAAPGRSRRAHPAVASAWPSTTSSCASRRSSAAPRSTRVGRRFARTRSNDDAGRGGPTMVGLLRLADEAGADGIARDARALLDRVGAGRFFALDFLHVPVASPGGGALNSPWLLAAAWLGLAPLATLIAIWLRISTALSEIVVGTVAQLVIGAASGKGALGAKAPWITFLSRTGAIWPLARDRRLREILVHRHGCHRERRHPDNHRQRLLSAPPSRFRERSLGRWASAGNRV